MVSMRPVLVWEVSCSIARVAWAATPMTVWKSERLWSVYLLAGFKVMLFHHEEASNPNTAGWLEKYFISLDADILPAIGTGKSSALAWHHDLQYLMLGASCGLEVPEIVLTRHRNPDDTEEVTTSASSHVASSSGVHWDSSRGYWLAGFPKLRFIPYAPICTKRLQSLPLQYQVWVDPGGELPG